MIVSDCPLTRDWNIYWNERIYKQFPILEEQPDAKCLSLKEYLVSIPQKFYNATTFENYYLFLLLLQKDVPNELVNFLKENAHEINIAIETLNEVNGLDIHDCNIEGFDELGSLRFIENSIHYNYLQLNESVFHKFILLIAINNRKKRGKPTDGLDIYNCVEEIKLTEFAYLSDCYNNTIRNGIAHGDFSYTHYGITYKGKKGSPFTADKRDVIRLFDNMVDFCNGLALAYKMFMITNQDFLNNNSILPPKSFLIQELKAQVNAPRWEVLDCFENYTIDNKKQLQIFTKNSLLDILSVNYFSFRTVVFAEYFAPEYDRYFVSLQSEHSLPGWGAYSGEILKKGRELNSIEGYQNVLENGMLFFIPKIKLPKFIRQIITTSTIIKNNGKLHFHQSTNNIFKKKYVLRDTKIHRRGLFLIANDPRIYIIPDYSADAAIIVRHEYKKIVKYAIRESKRELGRFNLSRLLGIKVIRVAVYDSDMRKRNYQNIGLSDALICTISVNKSRKIKEIDIIGGTLEQHGIYRIVWNKNWLIKNKITGYRYETE
jgi:hypothetical protein